MSAAEFLRARVRPEWKSNTELAGVAAMLENALMFIDAPKAIKDRVSQVKTLNALGVSQALRGELCKDLVPELRRIRREVSQRREAVERRRADLAQVKVDPTDLVGALLRQEIRTYLRGLNDSERVKALAVDADPRILTAALEAPSALSGLTRETREHVQAAYVRANHAKAIAALDQQEEALGVLDAASRIAIMQLQSVVGIGDTEFERWFSTADRSGRIAA